MTRMNSRLWAVILTIMMLAVFVFPCSANTLEATRFPDISGHWAESWITKFVNKKYIEGYPDGLFNPDWFITRAEAAAILSRLEIPQKHSGKTFTDVEDTAWYANIVEGAVKSGVIDGYTNGTFLPDKNITREEAFKICAYCVGKLDTSSITLSFDDDNEIGGWAVEYVKTLIQADLLTGYSDNTLKPRNFITRAEFVKLIQSILEMDYDLAENISSWRGETTVNPTEPTPERPTDKPSVGGGGSGKQIPQYTAPTKLTAEYGDTLAAVALPSGFSWEFDETAVLETLGEQAFTVKYTPTDTNRYQTVTGIAVILTVTPKTLTFVDSNLMLSPISNVVLNDALDLVSSDTISGSNITVTTTNTIGVTIADGAIVYNGATVSSLENQISFTITCLDSNYTVNNPVTANADIYDGIVSERAIPVMQKNITAFNGYAKLNTNNLSKFYKLYENIVLEMVDAGESNWVPIGTAGDGNGFSGFFDGNSKSISGLTINGGEDDNIGLFGHVDSYGVIENLSLDNATVSGDLRVGSISGYNGGTIDGCYYLSGTINGNHQIGGLAGDNSGIIENCGSNGNVAATGDCGGGIVGTNTSHISNCYSAGNTSGANQIGGIAGWSRGIIEDCRTSGNISGDTRVSGIGSDIGGVIGKNDGIIDKCYSIGNVASEGKSAGGIAGANHNQIKRSYSKGNISGANEVGGIAGYNGRESYVIIQDCYSIGNISGVNVYEGDNAKKIGGIVGSLQNGTVKWCYAAGNISGRFDAGGIVGWGNSGSVNHCIALNEYVTSGWGNRIVPSDGVWRDANYAYANMLLGSAGSETMVSSDYTNSKEGADITAFECKDITTWENLGFDFEETWGWCQDENGEHMPYLQIFGNDEILWSPSILD